MSRLTFLLPLCLLMPTCAGPAAPVPLQPVTGTVTYKGQPARGLIVQFCPTDPELARKLGGPSNAVVDEDGVFAAGTFASGDGLHAGTYRLVFYWGLRAEEEMRARGKQELEQFERRYGTWEAAGQTVEVREGSNTVPPIHLD